MAASARRLIKRIASSHKSLYLALKRLEQWSQYALGRVHEDDFLVFSRLPAQGTFVDIGANWGQSALSFAAVNKNWRIVSFEINPQLESALRRVKSLLGARYNYHMQGIGTAKSGTLYVPSANGVQYSGEATLHETLLAGSGVRRNVGRDFEVTPISVIVRPFLDFNLAPDIVKIDVQGHEYEVLASMNDVIARCRPVFLIETGEHIDNCAALLGELGYERFYRPSGTRSLAHASEFTHTLNYFFVHPASRTDVRATLFG